MPRPRPLSPQWTSVRPFGAADGEEARETSGNQESAGGESRRVISSLSLLPTASTPLSSLHPPPLHSRRLLSISRPLISPVSGGDLALPRRLPIRLGGETQEEDEKRKMMKKKREKKKMTMNKNYRGKKIKIWIFLKTTLVLIKQHYETQVEPTNQNKWKMCH